MVPGKLGGGYAGKGSARQPSASQRRVAPRAFVPVGQHPALAQAAVDAVFVSRRPMGVAMDDPGYAPFPERQGNGVDVHIHDLGLLAGLGLFAAFPQFPGQGMALRQGPGQEGGLPAGIPDLAAKRLVVDVVRAIGIPMGEQGGGAEQVDAWSGRLGRSGRRRGRRPRPRGNPGCRAGRKPGRRGARGDATPPRHRSESHPPGRHRRPRLRRNPPGCRARRPWGRFPP
jgi:hypothetical protein